MAHETQLEFIGVELRKPRFAVFCRAVEEMRTAAAGAPPFAYMLPCLRAETDVSGYLDWNLDSSARRALTRNTRETPVDLDAIDWSVVKHVFVEMQDQDGDTFARGKWRHIEKFVEWLCGYCKGGKVIQYSLEGDGEVGGWEFNGRGEWRELALTPVTGWRRPGGRRRATKSNMAADCRRPSRPRQPGRGPL